MKQVTKKKKMARRWFGNGEIRDVENMEEDAPTAAEVIKGFITPGDYQDESQLLDGINKRCGITDTEVADALDLEVEDLQRVREGFSPPYVRDAFRRIGWPPVMDVALEFKSEIHARRASERGEI